MPSRRQTENSALYLIQANSIFECSDTAKGFKAFDTPMSCQTNHRKSHGMFVRCLGSGHHPPRAAMAVIKRSSYEYDSVTCGQGDLAKLGSAQPEGLHEG